MPSKKQKVFAYLSQEIYSHVCEYKIRLQLPSDSQALIAILTEFFSCSKPEAPTIASNALQQRVEHLEQMVDSLNLMVLGILHATPEGELGETNGSVSADELKELSRKRQSLIICKVFRSDPCHPLYWSGNFKKGFVDQLELARAYKESTVKQMLTRIAKSQHAPVDKTEFLSYRALGELEAMAVAHTSN